MSVPSTALLAVRSVYEDQQDILESIVRLHCPDGFDADLTFGNGSFWKRLPRPRLCFDLTPLHEGVIQADSRMLPVEPNSIGNAVFDPPFLTYVKNGREHKGGAVQMTKRFGGYYTYEELEDHYRDTLSECYRVMRPKAKLVFKCQDIIHNHRMHCTHVRTILMAEAEGFRLADLFVLVARHRMPGPQKGTQRHARVWHSYFLVFERDGDVDVGTANAAAQARKSQLDKIAIRLCYRLGRHLLNPDNIPLPTWGRIGLELLAELRDMDTAKYMEAMKPNVQDQPRLAKEKRHEENQEAVACQP